MSKRKHSIKEWIIATRPWSFPASAMPVLVTLMYLYWTGDNEINWFTGVWALINVVLFHAAGNTWSDYQDFIKGVDTPDTCGATTMTTGQFSPKEIRNLSLMLLIIAVVAGVTLMFLTGWELFWFGLGGLLCVALYPYMKYRALGDLVIAISYAWLPCWGTSYVAIGSIDMSVWTLMIPVGCITVAILHSNNTRDVHSDAHANITTLAMKVGHRKAQMMHGFYLLFPFVMTLGCILWNLFPVWSFLVYLSLPMALRNVREMISCDVDNTSSISTLDQQTAQLQLLFSVLLSISFVIAAWI